MSAPHIAVLMWPDAFEDWYGPLGVSREDYLAGYDGEWLFGFAAALGAAGARATVVHATLGPAARGVQRGSGAEVRFVPASPGYRALRRAVWGHEHWERAQVAWPLAPWLSTAPRLLREVARGRPDAVVVQDYESPRFDVAGPALRAARLRVVGLDTGGSARPSGARRKRWTLRCADALLATHTKEAERVRRVHGHPAVAVWPAPLRERLRVVGDRGAARSRLGVAVGERIVLAVGRLHDVKGLPDLAAACAPLGCTLAIAGTGPQEAELRGRPGVRLLGALDPERLADWYAAADVVALASRQEGMPLTVLEALAAGRAVVATRVGGVPDVVRHGETGWLVPPRDVDALRAALSAALEGPEEADRRGRAGQALVAERHAPAAAGRELLRLILG
jgi:glycosyltransferase involved in cell wall biosynthesis